MNTGEPRGGPRRRPFLGSGPLLGIPPAVYVIASWIVSVRFPSIFIVRFPPAVVWYAAGAVLFVAGLAALGRSYAVLARARRERRLATAGPFARCRHPIYAAYLFYILPGVCLASTSWLVLAAPGVLYLGIIAFVGVEERKLAADFGREYADYAAKTPRLSVVPF